MQSFNKIILDNGLRIITVPKNDSLAVTVLVLVEAGSKYETKNINGLSHFLEHMCFKGTTKRPKAIDIAGELDAIGAEYNAFTSQEYTGYYAKAELSHTDKILDIVSDLYLNPTFDVKEIDKERGVIIEEINMYEDLPMRKVQEDFTSLLYGDQPAGWSIAGEKEVIKKLTKEDFLDYRKNHYVAKATTVVVAGKFDEKDAIEKIKVHFSGIHDGEKSGKEKTKEVQSKPEINVKFKESDQTHLVLGVRAYDIFDQRRWASQILADILGGGMSSRLFQKVREEMGAAYYVRAGVDEMSDHGVLAAAAGIDTKRLKEVVAAIIGEFKKIAEEGVDSETLKRAKDHLSGGLILSLETSDALATFYGGQEIIEKAILTPEEILKKVQAVTAEEIKEVAQDIFKNEKLNLAVIGPIKDDKDLREILSF